MQNRLTLAAVLVIALSACGQKPLEDPAVDNAPTTAPEASTEAPVAAAPVPAAVDPSFNIDKASLPDCVGTEATVRWDLRAEHPDVAFVEIWVGDDAAPRLFVAGGPFGEAKTAAWTTPGLIFSLRDKATGTELKRITVAGPACAA